MKNIKNRDPLKTKNGKTRLGPLNIAQIRELIDKTSSKKEKGRLRQRLDQLLSIKKVESVVDTTVESA